MALVNLDGVPMTQIGFPVRSGSFWTGGFTTLTTIDAVNEAAIYIGHVYTSDGASHVIDTTGASGLGWRTQNVSMFDPATLVKVGLAAVDTTNGPPVRAVNVGGLITMQVSRSIAGNSGGITDNLWQEHVPDTGSMTVANGDLVALCIQMTARGGTDLFNVGAVPQPYANISFPCATTYTSGAYAFSGFFPNGRIRFRDGATGFFAGGAVQNGFLNSLTWGSGSATKEYGNYFVLPYPVRINGVVAALALSGPADIVLYSNPLVTPVAQRTISLTPQMLSINTPGTMHLLFPASYDVPANQPFALVVKPGATSITFYSRTVKFAFDQQQDSGGTSVVGASRATGAFVTLPLERFTIGATISAFSHPAQSKYMLGV